MGTGTRSAFTTAYRTRVAHMVQLPAARDGTNVKLVRQAVDVLHFRVDHHPAIAVLLDMARPGPARLGRIQRDTTFGPHGAGTWQARRPVALSVPLQTPVCFCSPRSVLPRTSQRWCSPTMGIISERSLLAIPPIRQAT